MQGGEPRYEFSAALGLHVTDLRVGLNLVDQGAEQSFNDVTAPVPTLGGA